jgi:hypothetical protein
VIICHLSVSDSEPAYKQVHGLTTLPHFVKILEAINGKAGIISTSG